MYLGQADFVPPSVEITPQVFGTQPPASVPITPRIGTEAYANYWAMNAPLVSNPTAVQSSILSPGSSFGQGVPQWIYWALGGMAVLAVIAPGTRRN